MKWVFVFGSKLKHQNEVRMNFSRGNWILTTDFWILTTVFWVLTTKFLNHSHVDFADTWHMDFYDNQKANAEHDTWQLNSTQR